MIFYVSIGTIQDKIEQAGKGSVCGVSFSEVVKTIFNEGEYLAEKPENPDTSVFLSCNHESFAEKVRALAYAFRSEELFSEKEYDIVPENWEVTTASLFWGTEETIFRSDCFEIDYVLSGECRFRFLDEVRTLKKGDLCILTPHSMHSVTPLTSTSFVVPILVKEHSFERTFFPLLSNTDVMSGFFNTVLQSPESPNYLLFNTSGSYEIQVIVRQLFMERFFYDQYTSRSGMHWINLLFMHTLRDYSTYHQFSSYENGRDYAHILRYIERNYHTITLSDLAEKFNYTVPYMSKLIREITGKRFTDLVLKLRMRDAAALLDETDMSIELIAQKAGYNTTDHFTRSFKKLYQLSPSQYRRQKGRGQNIAAQEK